MTQAELQGIAERLGRGWRVLIRHLERVKWYAPHIRHVVLDINCRPHEDAIKQRSQAAKPGAVAEEPMQACSIAEPASPKVSASSIAGTAGLSALPASGIGSAIYSRAGPSSDGDPAITVEAASVTCREPGIASADGICRLDDSGAASSQNERGSGRELVVEELHEVSDEHFQQRVAPAKRPVILKGHDLGPAVSRYPILKGFFIHSCYLIPPIASLLHPGVVLSRHSKTPPIKIGQAL